MGLAAIRAFKAGCDLLLMMDGRATNAMVDALVNEIAGNAALERQLDASVRRLDRLRTKIAGAKPVPIDVDGIAAPLPDNCIRRGEKVREIQNALNERGFDAGAADGMWGSKSLQAMTEHERARGRQAAPCLTEDKYRQIMQG